MLHPRRVRAAENVISYARRKYARERRDRIAGVVLQGVRSRWAGTQGAQSAPAQHLL